MRKLLCFLALTILAAVAMADVNVTGNWSGSFNLTLPNGEMKDSTAFLKLKQSGADITGTVGPNEDEQSPIQKGTIDGNQITLEAEHQGHKIKFTLVLTGEHITGDANMAGDGETASAKLDVTRVK